VRERVRAACRRTLVRLPHHAIEHQRRRPLGSANTQPQSGIGHARTNRAAGIPSAAFARYPCAPGYALHRGICYPIGVHNYSNPVSGAVTGEAHGAARFVSSINYTHFGTGFLSESAFGFKSLRLPKITIVMPFAVNR
jgi:hypothetical protein